MAAHLLTLTNSFGTVITLLSPIAIYLMLTVFMFFVLRILSIDMVHISMVTPRDGTVEIIGVFILMPLTFVEQRLNLFVSTLTSSTLYVTVTANTIQINKVDVQQLLTLNTGQSEFGCHYSGDITGLILRMFEALCFCSNGKHQDCCHCEYHSFHNSSMFGLYHVYYLFQSQHVSANSYRLTSDGAKIRKR